MTERFCIKLSKREFEMVLAAFKVTDAIPETFRNNVNFFNQDDEIVLVNMIGRFTDYKKAFEQAEELLNNEELL